MSLNVYSNGALSKICGNFIVDSVLSKTSNNAIANAPVATKFEEIEQQMGSQDFTGTTAEVQAAIQAGTIDDDTIVYITDDSQESSVTASDITYDDGTVSGTTVQDALENTAGKFYATEAAAESDLANIEDGQMVYTDDGDDGITASEVAFDDKMSGTSVQAALGATMNGTFVNSNTGDFDNYNEPGNYVIYPSSGSLSQWSHSPITSPGMLFVMCASRSSSTGASANCTQLFITWEGSMMYVRTRWGSVWQNSGNWRRFQYVSS